MRTHLTLRLFTLFSLMLYMALIMAMGCSSSGEVGPTSTLIPIEVPTQYSFSKTLAIDASEFESDGNSASSLVMSHVNDVNGRLETILDITDEIIVNADDSVTVAVGVLEDGTDWIVDFSAYDFTLESTLLDVDFSETCSGNAAIYPVCARFYINGRRVMLTYLQSPVGGNSQGRGGFRLVATNTDSSSIDALLSGQEDYLVSASFDHTDHENRQSEIIWGSITPDDSGAVITSARAMMHEFTTELGTQVEVNTNISILENGDAGTATARLSWQRDDDCFYASTLTLDGSQGDTDIMDESLAFGTDTDTNCNTTIDTTVVPETIVNGAAAEDLGIPQDLTGPTVAAHTPAKDATSVDVNSSIVLTFSEAIASSTVDSNSIRIAPGVDGNFTVNDSIVTFTPDTAFNAGMKYSVTVTKDITDLSTPEAQAMPAAYGWSFTTAAVAGGAENDTEAPTVAATTPAADATGVSRSAAITADFIEDIASASVTTSSFTLEDSEGFIDASVAPGGTTLTLSPDAPLALLREYTATLTTDITDVAGNALEADHSWSFTVADGAWQTPELAESVSTATYISQFEYAANGDAIMIFSNFEDSATSLYAKHYDASTDTWSAERQVESSTESATRSDLTILPNGDAWLSFVHTNGGSPTAVHYNRYDRASDSWSGPQFLVNDSDSITWTFVLPKEDGDVMLRWITDDGADNYTMHQRDFDVSEESWSAEVTESAGTGVASMSCDTNNNLDSVCTWYSWDGTYYDVHGAYYQPSTDTWFPQVDLDGTDDSHAAAPVSVIDDDRVITIAWQEESGGTYLTKARRFALNTSGDTGVLTLENDTSAHAADVRVATDANNNAIVTWRKEDAGGQESIWASRFDNDTGLWSAVESLEDDELFDAYNAKVSMDADGNAAVIWRQNSAIGYDVYVNRYTVADDSWSGAELIENIDTGSASSPEVYLGANGAGFGFFRISEGDINVYMSKFR